MRMQLARSFFIAAAILLLACVAQAAPPVGVRAVQRVNSYIDNDGNRVLTPLTAVEVDANENLTVRAQVAYDVMTCASVDVISAATPKGYFEEVRQEYDAGVDVRMGTWTLSAGGVYSLENDYSSHSLSLGLSTELLQRNLTVALGYGFTDSDVGRASDTLFDRDLDSHVFTATLTQVLSPKLIMQVGYFLGALQGYQSSPYRMVSLVSGASSPESTPDERIRHAVVLGIKNALASTAFLSANYRYYLDTWGLDSHSAELAFEHQALPWFRWRVRNRIYFQSAVDFYRSQYVIPLRYMSADRELGAFFSDMSGIKLIFTPGFFETTQLSFDLKADFTWSRFEDYPKLPERSMWVT
ncbi:MAG TPA: DUF3570 domain-containing protein, partial [Myxococcales bacterium]|nr:DUF3570 domain-containing protein [Myxococcales bacterium]